MAKMILALDQGTTSSRAILFDHSGSIVSIAKKEFRQIYPGQGWVEHDPLDIWSGQAAVISEVMALKGLTHENIDAVGITNQRETTLVWERKSGKPVYNAIVWQDRRTADACRKMVEEGLGEMIRSKTGLIPDSYFSATKIRWILDNVNGAAEKAARGELCFGTVDSWLIWKLTEGKVHATDVTNASRTMLFNINTLQWDSELLDLFGIPATMLPEVKPSSALFGHTSGKITGGAIPVCGVAGDQQAALFGQQCIGEGMVKNTYGTGCFMVMNCGSKPVLSSNRLLTTVGWQIGDSVTYALEGSIFIAGAVIQWLRDELGIIPDASSSESIAMQAKDNGGIYFVPALSGLGAPHWDPHARGTITGITRGTGKAHIVRAALESMAYQVRDLLVAMEKDTGRSVRQLRVDGGASMNNFLMQFQSDILGCEVIRPVVMETTALGAAYFAGLASGYWNSMEEIAGQWKDDRSFIPGMDPNERENLLAGWQKAVNAAISPSLS